MRVFFRVAGAGALAAVVVTGEAAASGYGLREQSAVGQGTSFAGVTARGDDPSLSFFNPATIALLPGIQAALTASYISPYSEARNGTATRTTILGGGAIDGRVGGDAASDAVVPAFYATAQVAPDWTLGIAVTAPWGLVTKYDSDFIGRYHGLTSELATINVAPTIAWRALPNLSIGAAIQIQHIDARLSNAVDFGAVGFLNPQLRAAGFRPGARDGRATIEGDDVGFGVQLGAIWEPVPGTKLGAAWRSAVSHTLRGDARFEGVPAPLAGAFPANQGVRAKVVTPDIASLGLAQAVGDRWTLLADLSWTNWSRFRELRVDFENGTSSVTEERWRDTVSVALGAEYRWSDALRLRAGVAYDPTPVREETRTPRIPDSDRYWLSVGASWQATRNVELTAGYTHIFAQDTDVRLRDRGPGTSDFLRGNLDASYRASVDIFAVQARIAF
jgi:long-chain fatty acid transport protein